MAFRQCFLRPPELTKIVLQKFYKMLLHQIAPFGLANWTRKVFPVFPRNIPYRAKPKGPPFSFFRHCETFFPKKNFPQRVSPSLFLLFCDRMDVGKSLSVFSALWDFFSKKKFHERVPNSPILWHIEVLLVFLSLIYGADLGRSRLVLLNIGLRDGRLIDRESFSMSCLQILRFWRVNFCTFRFLWFT